MELTFSPFSRDVFLFGADVPLPRRPRGEDGIAGHADGVPVEVRVTHEVL